jgi:hypothetical protein
MYKEKIKQAKKITGYGAEDQGYIELIEYKTLWQIIRYDKDWNIIESRGYNHKENAEDYFNSWD